MNLNCEWLPAARRTPPARLTPHAFLMCGGHLVVRPASGGRDLRLNASVVRGRTFRSIITLSCDANRYDYDKLKKCDPGEDTRAVLDRRMRI